MIRSALLCCLFAHVGAETFMGSSGFWLEVEATAYSPLDDFTRDDLGNPKRLTATGVPTGIHPYGIAADPTYLEYGTRVIIPTGWGYLDRTYPKARMFTVDDTGPVVVRRTHATGVVHLDLRFKSISAALRFGHKRMAVFVITQPH